MRIGNAIQLGLMQVHGYDVPYAPDWEVLELEERPGHYYRFQVQGVNHNAQPGEYGYEYSWRIPALCWRYFWR